MNDFELTAKEKKAIAALKRVEKIWPESLWLFSASGTLCVMRYKQNGDTAVLSNEGMDSDYVVDTINIDNDGGDW